MHNVSNEIDVKPTPASGGAFLQKFLPIVVILAGLGLSYALGLQNYFSLTYLGEQREFLQNLVAQNYVLALASFFVIYTLATAFSFPAASILTIFGGFLFGWLASGLLVLFAATLGATILFTAAKSSFGGFLREKLAGTAASFADGFAKDAFSYLLVLRIAPIFPFFVTNIAPALFNVKTRDYVAATFLGIIPGVFAYSWLGEGVGSVLDAAKASGTMPSVKDLVTPEITTAFAAMAIVAALPLIIKRFRKPI
ncbi:MAG: TVP38/TMEM64 family protein [Rhizobiaceae bacterium]